MPRLGRKTRIGGRQREALWAMFGRVRAGLRERNVVTWADVFGRLAGHYAGGAKPPFDFAVVDEAQDLGVAEARFLAALASGRPEALFFAGDLGQRIFRQPFSWRALGIDVRGRSHPLRINHRTSHQIRRQADRASAGHPRRRSSRATGSRPRPATSPSAPRTSRKGWSSGPSPSWPATTRCYPRRSGSRASPTAPTSRRSTTRSGTCSTSPAPAPATTCWSRASTPRPSSWPTSPGVGQHGIITAEHEGVVFPLSHAERRRAVARACLTSQPLRLESPTLAACKRLCVALRLLSADRRMATPESTENANLLSLLVGAPRFELGTPSPPD